MTLEEYWRDSEAEEKYRQAWLEAERVIALWWPQPSQEWEK